MKCHTRARARISCGGVCIRFFNMLEYPLICAVMLHASPQQPARTPRFYPTSAINFYIVSSVQFFLLQVTCMVCYTHLNIRESQKIQALIWQWLWAVPKYALLALSPTARYNKWCTVGAGTANLDPWTLFPFLTSEQLVINDLLSLGCNPFLCFNLFQRQRQQALKKGRMPARTYEVKQWKAVVCLYKHAHPSMH